MMTAAPLNPSPGFVHTKVGSTVITVVSEGLLPIFAADMHGESTERITDLLADAFLPSEGDLHTAVNSYLTPLTPPC